MTLTALGTQYKCQMCHTAQAGLVTLAQTYHAHRKSVLSVRANETVMSNTTLTTEAMDADPVFFVNVDVESNRQIFDALGLQNAVRGTCACVCVCDV